MKDGTIVFDKYGYFLGCFWKTEDNKYRAYSRKEQVALLVYSAFEAESYIRVSAKG